jgi:excisionase family DNA binding protein
MEALLDINSVARLLSLSPWTIRRLISDGKLVPIRLGRRVLVEPVEVERLVSHPARLRTIVLWQTPKLPCLKLTCAFKNDFLYELSLA